MELVQKSIGKQPVITFGDIKTGEEFRTKATQDLIDDTVFMKIQRAGGAGEPRAVDLATGHIRDVEESLQVIPVVGVFTYYDALP